MATTKTVVFKVTNQSNTRISSKHKHPFNSGTAPTNVKNVTGVEWTQYFTATSVRTYKYYFKFYGTTDSAELGGYSTKINSNSGAVRCHWSETGLNWSAAVLTGVEGIYCRQSNSNYDSECYWRGTSSDPTTVTFTYNAYDAPGAPASCSITTAGSNKLTISFGASTPDSGTTVNYYQVGYNTTKEAANLTTLTTSPRTTGQVAVGTYYACARGHSAVSGYGSYKWSGAFTITKCGAPGSCSLSTIGGNKLRITITAGSGGTHNPIVTYRAGYGTASGTADATATNIGTNLTYDFSHTFTTGTFYGCARTEGGFGSNGFSAYKWSGAFTITACGAPSSCSRSISGNTVTVSWPAGTAGTHNAITGYGVGYNTTNATAANVKTVTGTSTTFTLSATGSYYFCVRTQGGFGSNGYSGYKWSSVLTIGAATAPTACSVALSGDEDNKIKISFSGASGGTNNAISNYHVGYNTTSGTVANAANVSSSPRTSGAIALGTWYGCARANCAVVNTAYKWSGAFTITACTAPSSCSRSISGNTVTVSWPAGSGGTHNALKRYRVGYNTNNSTAANTKTVTTTSTTFSFSATGTYYFCVRTEGAFGSNGYSGYKWSGALTIGAATAPTSCSIALSGNEDNKISISWSGAAGGTNNAISNYNVGYNTTSGTVANNTNVSSSPRTSNAIAVGTWYGCVRANCAVVNTAYKWSGAFTITACTAPTSVSASMSGATANVSWSGAAGGTHNAFARYRVGYNTNNTTTANLKAVTTTNTTFGLSATGTYYFCVRTEGAFGSNGYSAYKWSGALTIGAATAPTACSIALSGDEDNKIKISWSGAASGTNNAISSYNVGYNTTSGTVANNTNVSSSPRTSNAIALGTWYGCARANCAVVNTAYKWSGAFTITACSAPSSCSASISGATVTASWPAATAGTNNAIKRYRAGYNTNNSTAANLKTVNTTNTTFTLSATGTYYFCVRTEGAFGSNGYSAYRWSGALTIGAATAPTACSVALSGNADNKIKISWSGAAGGTNNAISNYNVGYSMTNGTVANNSNVSSSPLTSVAVALGTWYGCARANCAVVNTAYKWSGAFTITACTSPTSVTYSLSGATATVSWSGAAGGTNNSITSYYVGYNTNNSTAANLTTVTTSATSGSTTKTLSALGTYYFCVRTQGAFGSNGYSGYKWSGALTIGAATAPTSCSVALSGNADNKIKISWSGAANGTNNAITNYSVGYSTTNGTTANLANVSSSPRTSNAISVGTWYGCARANCAVVNTAYKWSGAFTITACTAPTSVTASYANGVLSVSWSGASGGTNNTITGYGVGYSTSSGGTVSGEKTVTGTSTTFIGLSSGTTYYIAVRTKGTFGSNGWSGYKWSAAVTYTHPTVNIGDKITKSQMDILRTFKGNSPTAVTQYATITTTVGNTYKATTGGGAIAASWYNGA